MSAFDPKMAFGIESCEPDQPWDEWAFHNRDMLLSLLPAPISADFQDVFVSGRMDVSVPYDTFRIPAICRTAKGTLLAFAEGRRSVSDQASNVLVLRRRASRSKAWGPLQVVERDEPNSLNNPCVLPTRQGRVWLMYQRYPAGLNEMTAEPGLSRERSCLTYLTFSDDDGRSWSAPRDISAEAKASNDRSDASGPGIGIELTRGPHRGRMVFPLNGGGGGKYDVFAVFSDDHGRTWQRGTVAPKGPDLQPNETQIAELADGSILMNCRNQAKGRFRLQCRSLDGGATWSEATPRPDLVDPVCMGSIVRLSFKPDLLAFSNPNDPKTRRNGTLRLSSDCGTTWVPAGVIAPDSFAYSNLCPLPGGRIGILFEQVSDLGGGREGYRIRYGEWRPTMP